MRNCYGNLSTNTKLRLHLDSAIHNLNQTLYNRHSKSGAFHPTLSCIMLA